MMGGAMLRARRTLGAASVGLVVVSIFVLLSACDSGPGAAPPTAQVMLDTPLPPAVGVDALRRILFPEGGSTFYRIRLKTRPAEPVTITISGAEGTGLTVVPNVLVFTPDEYGFKRVVVKTEPDKEAESDVQVTLTHTAAGGGYAGLEIEPLVEGFDKGLPVSVLSVDDDREPPSGVGVEREFEIETADFVVYRWITGSAAFARYPMPEIDTDLWCYRMVTGHIVEPSGQANPLTYYAKDGVQFLTEYASGEVEFLAGYVPGEFRLMVRARRDAEGLREALHRFEGWKLRVVIKDRSRTPLRSVGCSGRLPPP